ncbi:malectin domain-containing carbohydrate-binding protein, partial [Elusimicrobiota bacterium]
MIKKIKLISFLSVLLICLFFKTRLLADIVINEVGMDSKPDWVELYNNGTAGVDISGWTINDEDSSVPVRITSAIIIPAGAYLLVYIEARGTNDLDFSDGTGVFYAGKTPKVNLSSVEDEVALYNSSTQNPTTIVDFVSYCSDGSYGGTSDQQNAVDAGIWTAATYIEFTDTGSNYSIGLVQDGVDTDNIQNWSFYESPTPGAANAEDNSLDAPVLNTIPDPDIDGNYDLAWNMVTGATGYLVIEAEDDVFTVNVTSYYPVQTTMPVTNKPNGTYYYKVMALNDTVSSEWSNMISVTVQIPLDIPAVSLADVDGDGNYSVSWVPVSGAMIYQLQEDTVDTFDSTDKKEFWPSESFENISGQSDGLYYYRISAWTEAPENGGFSSQWSDTESIVVMKGAVKRINCNGNSYVDVSSRTYASDTAYSGDTLMGYVNGGSTEAVVDPISSTEDDIIYQSNRYGNLEYRFDLPAGVYNITLKFAETYWNTSGQRIFNVYLQDLDDDNRGIKVLTGFDIFDAASGKNTAVDRVFENITVNEGNLKITFEGIVDNACISAIEIEDTPYIVAGDIGMTDEEFIDMVEYKAFQWFYDNVSPPYYLAPAWGPYDDVGLGIDTNIAGIGFQLIVYCIGIERGWMSYEEGYSRVKGIFDGIRLMRKGPIEGDENPYETYWHYYERLNPQNPLPAQDPVRSIFDNGDFMMGVVFAEEYFRGTQIELMAKQVYESLDWNSFGDYTWPTYSEEMIAVLLGASSPRSSCRNDTMITGFDNASGDPHTPLYFYQWLNLFYDGRNTNTPSGRNDFNFSQTATLTNRQDCVDLWQNDPAEYNTYDWDTWGYTAASRYNEYGFASHYNGDVNPFAVAASMPFAPAECLSAMKHMYWRFYKNGYREYIGPVWSDLYGFCQTYNIGTSNEGVPFYMAAGNGSFDFGPIVMGIENYKSGFVWNHTMNSEYIKAGMYRIGMSGYDSPPEINIAQDKPVVVSSYKDENTGEIAVDDDLITRWESDWTANDQWLYIDLTDIHDIDKIEIFWENAYAVSYQIQTSNDASSWTDIYVTNSSDGAVDRIDFTAGERGRYVRIYCTEKSLYDYGYSIWGIKVFGGLTPTIAAPAVENIPSPDGDGNYLVKWNNVAGATIYQVEEDTVNTFDGIDFRQLSYDANIATITSRSPDTYYYRVKAWQGDPADPESISSNWSNTVNVIVPVPPSELQKYSPNGEEGWRLNCGAEQYDHTDPDGNLWPRDEIFADPASGAGLWRWGYDGGWAAGQSTQTVTGTNIGFVFQTQHWGPANYFQYKIEVPNGNYEVTLMFCETHFTASGQRKFDVAIENQIVLDDHDIFAEVGGNAADEHFFQVTVNDQRLDITFPEALEDNPVISGIEVRPLNLTDDEFLDFIERKMFWYFWNETNPDNGLISDREHNFDYGDPHAASIASTGYGLSILTIGADRGWITHQMALERIHSTLDAFLDPEVIENVHGFWYHFMNLDGSRSGTSELSSIDSALFIMGALQVGEYYRSTDPTVAQKAQTLYEQMDWTWWLNRTFPGDENSPDRYHINMGWKPENTEPIPNTGPEGGSFVGNWWNQYSETVFGDLLAFGSPTYP